MLANMAAGGGPQLPAMGSCKQLSAPCWHVHGVRCNARAALHALSCDCCAPLVHGFFLENFVQAVASSAVSRVPPKSSMDCLCFSRISCFEVMALAEGHNLPRLLLAQPKYPAFIAGIVGLLDAAHLITSVSCLLTRGGVRQCGRFGVECLHERLQLASVGC